MVAGKDYSLREQQSQAIDEMEPGIQLWLAQTGFGKSIVAWEASQGKRVVIATHTISLQQQYEREFGSQVFMFMGRSHSHCGLGSGKGLMEWCLDYRCPHLHCYDEQHEVEETTVADAGCDINYFRAMAGQARVIVTNYHAYHYSKQHFGQRDIFWADEAQHMPIEDLRAVIVPRYAIPDGIEAKLLHMQNPENVTKKSLSEMSDGMNLIREQIIDAVLDREHENLHPSVFSADEHLYSNRSFTLNDQFLECKPIHKGDYGTQLFLRDTPTAVAMSGTLIHGSQIGVKDHNVKRFFPQLPSPEVITWKRRAKNRDERFANVMEAVSGNRGERGVVFFASRRETREFADAHPSRRWVLQRSPGAREEIEELALSDDGVLLTYGGHEGLDLVDDLARFGVLAKMPFLNLGDVHTKAEFVVKGWPWYNQECGLKIRQAAGRLIRHKGDYGEFYMADRGSIRFPHEATWANPVLGVYGPEKWELI